MVPDSAAPHDVAGFDPVATAGECWYDAEAAEHAVRFIQSLRHTKGKWGRNKQRVKLEPWQRAFIRTLFGWKRPDGTRRFRVVFLFIPRKNGKSFLAAAIALYVLYCDKEAEAECYCAAGSRDQANLVFRQAASMVRAEEVLDKRCKIRDSLYRINMDGSFMRAIPANEGNAHGFNAHLIVGDELHTWPNRDFYETLHTSTGARDQPLEVYITTAGHDQQSICREVYDRACAVRDGKVEDETFLPAIYEAGKDDDFTDPATWRRANPNFGVSISEEYIRREAQKAQESPAYENTFRRLHLNQWTAQDERWLPMDAWRECGMDPCSVVAMPLHAGLDLSSTRDFTAFAVAGVRDGRIHCRVQLWAPEERVDYLSRKHNIDIARWVRDGWLTVTPGASINYEPIIEHIDAVSRKEDLRTVAYDPWNAHAVRLELEDQRGIQMVEYRQGMRTMSGPAKALERAVIDGRLRHGGNPALTWMADNVSVKRDENGNIMPTKGRDKSYRHIDGIVALIMAIGEAEAGSGGEALDYYESNTLEIG